VSPVLKKLVFSNSPDEVSLEIASTISTCQWSSACKFLLVLCEFASGMCYLAIH
jgi:hypothetical protein